MSTLSLTLGVSIAIHAALLTVRFVAPEQFNRVFQDTPLEVILVNAQTQERPEKAQAIAQAALAGGDAARGRFLSSPGIDRNQISGRLREDWRIRDARICRKPLSG